MKKMILIISLTTLLLVGCDTDTSNASGKNVLIIKDDSTSYTEYLDTCIVTDTENDVDYIVVKNTATGGGIAITPRLRSNP